MIITKKKLFFIFSVVLIITMFFSVIVPLCMKASSVLNSLKKVPVYNVETNEKKIALTINCAWEDDDTDAFLQTLEKYNVKATFFVVGEFAQRCENAVLRISKKGHEIGTHSDTHADMTKLDANAITRELLNSSEKIEKITGIKPTLFRAPSGAYNNAVISTAEELGFVSVQWDVDTIDWKVKTTENMLKIIDKKTKNGSIILMHLGAEYSKEALPKIIKTLIENEYQLVTVSELLYPKDASYIDSNGTQHRKTAVE